MNRLHLVLALLALLCGCAQSPAPAAGPWTIPAEPGQFHVFLLMGQSNMAGYGGIAPGDPWLPGDREPVPGILVLDGQGSPQNPKPLEAVAWRPGSHRLHLHQGTAQFGLGLDFAKAYLKDHPGVTVGLIPCAWGGAPIDELAKGTPLFTNAMMRLREAQKMGVIRGVLWHQGESDSVNATLVLAYEGKLRRLMADVRREAGDPHLPFVIGNLAEFYGVNPGHGGRIALINQVRGILYKVGSDDPDAAFVPSTGLMSCDAHQVHFNRASYVIFGQRYAAALTALQRRQTASGRP